MSYHPTEYTFDLSPLKDVDSTSRIIDKQWTVDYPMFRFAYVASLQICENNEIILSTDLGDISISTDGGESILVSTPDGKNLVINSTLTFAGTGEVVLKAFVDTENGLKDFSVREIQTFPKTITVKWGDLSYTSLFVRPNLDIRDLGPSDIIYNGDDVPEIYNNFPPFGVFKNPVYNPIYKPVDRDIITYNIFCPLAVLNVPKYSQIIDGYWKKDGDMLTIEGYLMITKVETEGLRSSVDGIVELLNFGDKKLSLVVDDTRTSVTSKMEGCPNGLKDFTLEELKQFPIFITVSGIKYPDENLTAFSQTKLFSLESTELPLEGGHVDIGGWSNYIPINYNNVVSYNLSFLLSTLTASRYSQLVYEYWKNDGDMLTITSDMDIPIPIDIMLIDVGGKKKISLVSSGKTLKSKMQGCPNGLADFTLDELKQFPSRIDLALVLHSGAKIVHAHSQTKLFSLESTELPLEGGDVVIGTTMLSTTIDFVFPVSDYTNDEYRKIVDNKWKDDGGMINLVLSGNYHIDIDIDHIVYSDIVSDEIIPLIQFGNKKLACVFNSDTGTLFSKMEECPYGLKSFSIDELRKFPRRMSVIIRREDSPGKIFLATDEYIDTAPNPTDKPIDDDLLTDDIKYYFEMGIVKNIRPVLKFTCENDDDAGDDVCMFALSENKSDKFNNVIQLTKNFYVISPHSSNHIMFYSHTVSGTRAAGQTKAGAWWCFPIDSYGMTGPLIVKRDDVFEKLIILCQSTFKFIVMDISIIRNLQAINLGNSSVYEDLFIYSSDPGNIFYWNNEGVKTPWDMMTSQDQVLSDTWNMIHENCLVNSFPISWYNTIYTLDDVSIVKYKKSELEFNWCISFIYTPKDETTVTFPILTANIDTAGKVGIIATPPIVNSQSSSGNAHEYSQAPGSFEELSPFIDSSFTKIKVIPNSLVRNIFIPGRSDFAVYQVIQGNNLIWYSHEIISAAGGTPLLSRAKFSSGGCINISSINNTVTSRIFLAPKYEKKIYAFNVYDKKSEMAEWIQCPDADDATGSGSPLFSNAISYNVMMDNISSFVNNCIVFVPDSASHFLKIKFTNSANQIDWIPMVVRNVEEWGNAGSKFMYTDYNHRHFETGAGGSDRLLVNVYGGNIKRNVIVSIETIPRDVSTDNTLVVVKESHISHHGGLAFYDPVRDITISLPDRTDSITSVSGGMFNTDVDMCRFFKFDCVECSGTIYDLFNDKNIASSTDAITNIAWMTAFKETLEDKEYVDGDPARCYTLNTILYNPNKENSLLGFTKPPVGTESLLTILFSIPNDSFDASGVNWCSTGFKRVYDAVKTSLYNFSNDNAVITALNVSLETTTSNIGWVTKICNDVVLRKPVGHQGSWNYDDPKFVERIETIIKQGTDFEMNVLGIASCWKGNYLSGALIDRYIKYCRGDANCIATFKNDYNPLCNSNVCIDWDKISGDTYGSHNYHFTWTDLCTKDITIMNCTTNMDGSLIEGDVDSCTMCGPGTTLCGDAAANGDDEKNKTLLYLGLGAGIVFIGVVVLIVVLSNKNSSKKLELQIQQVLDSRPAKKMPNRKIKSL